MMASAIKMSDGNYSAFLAGRRGIGAETTCLLLKFIAMRKPEAVATFTKPAPTSRIMLLQEQGRKMRLDVNDGSGWLPREGSTDDPNDTGTIDDTPDNETLDTLRSLRGVHRKIIRVLNDYINAAKINQGSTAPTDQKFGRRS
jgi:hypothetical protein